MNPTVAQIQNAIYQSALENIRSGRHSNGRPVVDLLELRAAAKQALEQAKQAEERYGKNGN